MKNKTLKTAIILLLGIFATTPLAIADTLPTSIGECRNTFVKNIRYPVSVLDDFGVYMPNPNSGSEILYTNGAFQTSYVFIPALHQSKRGDEVRLCLTFKLEDLSKRCKKNIPADERDNRYLATNIRTQKSWELVDGSCSYEFLH